MKVIVAILDWGLGHATRSVPLIQALLERDLEVVLAGNGDSLEYLVAEFPLLKAIKLPAYAVEYPSSGNMTLKMLRQMPRLRKVIKREHQVLEEIVAHEGAELVISDNRYGCWSAKVPSILITHQTTILLPAYMKWLRKSVAWYNRKLIYHFTQCWVPDYPGAHSLAGKLARFPDGIPARFRYIGNLSRFSGTLPPIAVSQTTYDVAVVLSGPEPQRSILENIILTQLTRTTLRAFVVRGTRHPTKPLPDGVEGADFLNTEELEALVNKSACVVARSGYSTIMDLAKLGKKAIFIPTPGQTEQEYLARRLKLMKLAYSATQRQFNLKRAWRASKYYTGFNFMPGRFNMLQDNISGLLDWMNKRTLKKAIR
ncbi:glycosyltransferase [Chryseolinea sp. T2]|uniref:glycosyltransferase n=1 Tax=Chryseolinea sp. T2 TaxID=3129255 RepID=UPI003076EF78